MGASRRGPSLGSGFVVCGTWGHRLPGRDGGPRTVQSEVCGRAVRDYGGDSGQSVAGEPIDTFVTPWGLKALEPAALPLSLAATARLEQARQTLEQLWPQRWERAVDESERAARPYRLIEPEQRLGARQLAKDWDDKLAAQRPWQEEDERFVHTQSRVRSAVERATIEPLAQPSPALWYAPPPTGAARKERMRHIIQRVIGQVEGVSERRHITIEWVGGGVTAGITTRPGRRTETLSASPRLCERLRALAAAGESMVKSTACLAQAGFRSPRPDRALNRQTVVELMRRLAMRQPGRQPRPRLGPHEWRVSALEHEVARTHSTWHQGRTRGWLKARGYAPEPWWVVWADEAEWERLTARCARSAGEGTHTMWLDGQAAQRTDASRLSPMESLFRGA
jgi:hypothetical protein